jgi:glycosyltransferase involved in cell wall biosynthesis
MACSLLVVASPVGVNSEIVSHGSNGFLADSPDEWVWALGRLLKESELRQSMGQEGRRKVESAYCLQVTAPRLSAMLKQSAAEAH